MSSNVFPNNLLFNIFILYPYNNLLQPPGGFTNMNIMTKGGPNKSTYTLTYMMYNAAFKKSQYGYGLAAASVMVVECMAVLLIINFIFRDKNQEKEEERSRRKRGA